MVENLCVLNNCHACCDSPRLSLNLVEAATLRNLGTTLLGLHQFDGKRNSLRGRDGKAYYDMDGTCGALNSEGLCNVYDSQLRPKVCATLEPGSADCLTIRREKRLGELRTY